MSDVAVTNNNLSQGRGDEDPGRTEKEDTMSSQLTGVAGVHYVVAYLSHLGFGGYVFVTPCEIVRRHRESRPYRRRGSTEVPGLVHISSTLSRKAKTAGNFSKSASGCESNVPPMRVQR